MLNMCMKLKKIPGQPKLKPMDNLSIKCAIIPDTEADKKLG